MSKTSLKINPLNVFKIRKTTYLPNHFECANIPFTYNIQDAVEKWINSNLKGRYYISKDIELDSKNTINSVIKVGFEDSKELSFFMLACPHLKYK
jgi:hypothetical protein